MTTITPGRDPSTLTMSSREIAALVESRHDKVKQSIERLADRGLISFTPVGETSHEGPGARPVTVYHVNKRDSYIVVAQLSPEFTARLVDRWQELEEAARQPAAPATAIPAAREFTALFKVARLLGLDRNVAAVSANQATAHSTGVNLMRLLGHEELEEAVQAAWFTPTELGESIGVSGRQINLMLMEAGLQTKEGKLWLPTDAAKNLFRWYGTGKKHGDGTLVQQLKWSREVLPRLNQEAA